MSPLASYVFLAEFDIDVGPTLAKQFPLPIGVQELEQSVEVRYLDTPVSLSVRC